MTKIPFALAATLALSACGSLYVSYPQAKAMADDPAIARRYLSNTTVNTWDAYHHHQYEYLAADGTTELLYPGNMAPLPGQWEIEGAGEFHANICFRYGADSWNPVTRQGGDGWECSNLLEYLYDTVVEIYDGDVFGARKIKAFARPFPDWSGYMPIAKAVAETGQPAPKSQNKALSKARE